MNDPNPPCPAPLTPLAPEFIRELGHGDRQFMVTCDGETKKLITTGSGFILKGDGWASDGYGGGSNL